MQELSSLGSKHHAVPFMLQLNCVLILNPATDFLTAVIVAGRISIDKRDHRVVVDIIP